MPTPININIQTPQIAGAPQISVKELEQKIQEYVNSLYVSVKIPKSESSVKHHHSLSGLRGICKSGISDKQALDEYLAEEELKESICVKKFGNSEFQQKCLPTTF